MHYFFELLLLAGLVALLIAVVWLAWKAFGQNKNTDKTSENV